jgi:hypothetical protein
MTLLILAMVAIAAALWVKTVSGGSPVPFGQADRTALEGRLGSKHRSEFLMAFDATIARSGSATLPESLPAGTSLEIDPTSVSVAGDAATATARLTGTRHGRWRLYLVKQGGRWVVLTAEPIR